MMDKTEHLLVCLLEECAEVQQAVTKALRFGLEGVNPNKPEFSTNAKNIIREYCDTIAVIELLVEEGILEERSSDEVSSMVWIAKTKKRQFMKIACQCGTLSDKEDTR